MSDLKPCPFCGGKAIIARTKKTLRNQYAVSCVNSRCIAERLSNPFVMHFLTKRKPSKHGIGGRMNNDLIKRIAVCDMLHDEMGAWGSCADEIEALLKANDALWEIPSVDAVEVVRCRECKHYHKQTGWCNEHSSFIDDRGAKCHPWESSEWRIFAEDDFCSYGERKGGA